MFYPKEHFLNLSKVLSEFQESREVCICSHFNSELDYLENLPFIHEKDKLSIFDSFIDNEGNTQFIFAQPFNINYFYISCVEYVAGGKTQTDKIIFQIYCEA